MNYKRQTTDELVKVYFPSLTAEVIDDVDDFFITHMLKIVERMENYNTRGSNLLLYNIEEIHIHVSCLN